MRNNYDGLTRAQWRSKQPKHRAYLKRHQEYLKRTGYYKARYQRLKAAFKRQGEDYRNRLRIEVFAHYGKVCACCGEQNPLFLTLGHINNDGAAHRRQLNKLTGKNKIWGGYSFYLWLKQNKYPPLPIQVECYNCNCGKVRAGGVCPHLAVAADSFISAK